MMAHTYDTHLLSLVLTRICLMVNDTVIRVVAIMYLFTLLHY